MSGRYRKVLWRGGITVLALSEMYCTFPWRCSWFPPSHVGNGLSHWPSFPHTSSELPFSCFPGTSQLNVRKRSGRMAWLLSGSPLTTTCPSSGGRSHVKAEKARKRVKGRDSCPQTAQFKTSATTERGAGKTYARTLARDWSICPTYKFWCPLCSPSDIYKQKQVSGVCWPVTGRSYSGYYGYHYFVVSVGRALTRRCKSIWWLIQKQTRPLW